MKSDRDALAARVAAIQEPILEAARSTFTAREIANLRGVARLAVEFQDYMQRDEASTTNPDDVRYLSGSVFAGVDSFASVAAAYSILVGATASTIEWAEVSTLNSRTLFRQRYLALYQEFISEAKFEVKCRVLLDLFKLQIVFVGLLYNW